MVYSQALESIYEVQNVIQNTTGYLEPIPITSEWLQKLGFDMDDDMEEGVIRFLKIIDEVSLRWNGFMELEVRNKYVTTYFDLDHIKYVHQLQNLYFALTGTELTVKQ